MSQVLWEQQRDGRVRISLKSRHMIPRLVVLCLWALVPVFIFVLSCVTAIESVWQLLLGFALLILSETACIYIFGAMAAKSNPVIHLSKERLIVKYPWPLHERARVIRREEFQRMESSDAGDIMVVTSRGSWLLVRELPAPDAAELVASLRKWFALDSRPTYPRGAQPCSDLMSETSGDTTTYRIRTHRSPQILRRWLLDILLLLAVSAVLLLRRDQKGPGAGDLPLLLMDALAVCYCLWGIHKWAARRPVLAAQLSETGKHLRVRIWTGREVSLLISALLLMPLLAFLGRLITLWMIVRATPGTQWWQVYEPQGGDFYALIISP